MRNKSKIYNISKEEMKEWLNNHSDMNELFDFIGFRRAGGNLKTVQKYMIENNLEEDYKIFRKKVLENGHKKAGQSNQVLFEDMFCENSKINRSAAKKRIIKDSLIEYKCAICGNKGEWNGKKLVLQLDHINGIYNDHRLENLRFLCPNCHSQTETFCGSNRPKPMPTEKKILRQKRKEEYEKKLNDLEQERWKQIEESNIDFSKFGWVKELSEIWGVASNKAGKYVRKHFPKFYEEKCFQRL